jgi:predicted Rossmann fold flavoprotein
MLPTRCDVLVGGGGPAGLRMAEITSAAGLKTVLADHKPSVGRKLLVAGRGGLNLTHSEPVENFPARYGRGEDSLESWRKLLAGFSPEDLRSWVHGLGVETFIGTSGRVFPVEKQAAPLLRRWVERLRRQGVSFRPRHELRELSRSERESWDVTFRHDDEKIIIHAQAVALALGGASWPQTGSDGQGTQRLAEMGIEVKPFAPANCGYEIEWPATFLLAAEGSR